jgi:hypothetical protein
VSGLQSVTHPSLPQLLGWLESLPYEHVLLVAHHGVLAALTGRHLKNVEMMSFTLTEGVLSETEMESESAGEGEGEGVSEKKKDC